MSEIRLYVEGGRDKDSKARVRQAFSHFILESLDPRRVRDRASYCDTLFTELLRALGRGPKGLPGAAESRSF